MLIFAFAVQKLSPDAVPIREIFYHPHPFSLDPKSRKERDARFREEAVKKWRKKRVRREEPNVAKKL